MYSWSRIVFSGKFGSSKRMRVGSSRVIHECRFEQRTCIYGMSSYVSPILWADLHESTFAHIGYMKRQGTVVLKLTHWQRHQAVATVIPPGQSRPPRFSRVQSLATHEHTQLYDALERTFCHNPPHDPVIPNHQSSFPTSPSGAGIYTSHNGKCSSSPFTTNDPQSFLSRPSNSNFRTKSRPSLRDGSAPSLVLANAYL